MADPIPEQERRRMSGNDWTTGELVRSVIALTESIRDLKATIDDLDDKFVLRAVHDVELANVRQTQRQQGDALDHIEQVSIPNLHKRIDGAVTKVTAWQLVGAFLALLAVAATIAGVLIT